MMQREGGERDLPVHSPNDITARVGPDQSLEPGASFWVLMWVQGPKCLCYSPLLSFACYQAAGSQVEHQGLKSAHIKGASSQEA